jgi:hypothetical protein
VGRYDIKESARLLNQFIPVLSVSPADEYADIWRDHHRSTLTRRDVFNQLGALPQTRAQVAAYCLQMDSLTADQQEKLRQVLTAKGRAIPIPYTRDGSVDMDASRRVEFKFV